MSRRSSPNAQEILPYSAEERSQLLIDTIQQNPVNWTLLFWLLDAPEKVLCTQEEKNYRVETCAQEAIFIKFELKLIQVLIDFLDEIKTMGKARSDNSELFQAKRRAFLEKLITLKNQAITKRSEKEQEKRRYDNIAMNARCLFLKIRPPALSYTLCSFTDNELIEVDKLYVKVEYGMLIYRLISPLYKDVKGEISLRELSKTAAYNLTSYKTVEAFRPFLWEILQIIAQNTHAVIDPNYRIEINAGYDTYASIVAYYDQKFTDFLEKSIVKFEGQLNNTDIPLKQLTFQAHQNLKAKQEKKSDLDTKYHLVRDQDTLETRSRIILQCDPRSLGTNLPPRLQATYEKKREVETRNSYELQLMPTDIKQEDLQQQVIYLENDGDGLKYTIVTPDNRIISDHMEPKELVNPEKESIKSVVTTPLDLDKVKSLKSRILGALIERQQIIYARQNPWNATLEALMKTPITLDEIRNADIDTVLTQAINTVDEDGNTILHNQVRAGNIKLALWLLNHGANPKLYRTVPDDELLTKTNNIVFSDWLLEKATNKAIPQATQIRALDQPFFDDGMTLLERAIRDENLSAFDTFLQAGIDPMVQNILNQSVMDILFTLGTERKHNPQAGKDKKIIEDFMACFIAYLGSKKAVELWNTEIPEVESWALDKRRSPVKTSPITDRLEGLKAKVLHYLNTVSLELIREDWLVKQPNRTWLFKSTYPQFKMRWEYAKNLLLALRQSVRENNPDILDEAINQAEAEFAKQGMTGLLGGSRLRKSISDSWDGYKKTNFVEDYRLYSEHKQLYNRNRQLEAALAASEQRREEDREKLKK